MKIGDKVVFVNNEPCLCGCGEQYLLEVNNVYVIKNFETAINIRGENHVRIFLIGVKDSTKIHLNLDSFPAWRFRLLDDLKELNKLKHELSLSQH